MKRLKGIYQNCDPVDQPEGYYRDAKNILIDDKVGSLLSETIAENVQEITALLGKNILHVALFKSTTDFVLFYEDSGSLYLYDSDTAILVPSVSGQSISVQSDVFVNKFDQEIIVFTTGSGPAYSYNRSSNEITTLFPTVNGFPIIQNPKVEETGGNLKAGVYYIAVAYKHDDGTITNFYDVAGPFYVTQSSQSIGSFYGSETDVSTSKSISFSFSTADTSYESYIIGVIPVYDGIIGDVQILPEISISSEKYTYTGNEAYTPGSLAEIQIDKAFYDKPQTIHIQEDITYLGNLSKPDYNGIQEFVNSISVKPTIKQFDNQYFTTQTFASGGITSGTIRIEPANGFRDPNTARQYAGYKRGEVYAIYISFLLDNGGETPAFHIPGRQATGSEGEYVSGTNAQTTFEFEREFASSGVIEQILFTYNSKSVSIKNVSLSEPLVNQVETAINNAYQTGTFDAQVVNKQGREFTVQSRFAGIDGEISFAWDTTFLSPSTGIRVKNIGLYQADSSAVLDYSDIAGYMIESVGSNSSTMGFWKNISEYYPSDFPTFDGQNVRHHHFPEIKSIPLYGAGNVLQVLGFKLEFSNTTIPNSIAGKIKGYKVYYAKRTNANKRIVDQGVPIKGKIDSQGNLIPSRRFPDISAAGSFSDAQEYYFHPFSMMVDKKNAGGINYMKQVRQGSLDSSVEVNYSGQCNLLTANHIHNSDVLQNNFERIYGAAYVDSTLSESITSLEFAGISKSMNNKNGESKLVVRPVSDFITSPNTYLTDLVSVKSNVYQSYDTQELVSTGYIHTDLTNLNSGDIFGGDTFLCNYVWKAYNSQDNEVCVHSALVESSYNINYRGVGLNPWESFYPIMDQGDFGSPAYGNGSFGVIDSSRTIFNDNYFSYNKSYSYPNQFKFPTIISKYNQAPEHYPTRVIRSSSKQSRTFLQDDYIDLPTKRGQLIKLDSYNNTLIAHLEKALIRTKGREELVAGDVRAFVGSGDIFAIKPEEMIYTADGFGGIQDKRHSLATNYGYFFWDDDAKKLFVLQTNGIKDITDTIFPIAQGLTGDMSWGQDPKFGRVFFKAGSTVLSYSSKMENWISRHEWFVDQSNLLFANNRELGYLFNNATFHEVNNHTLGYNTPAFEYTFVDNFEPDQEKEFASLSVQGSKGNSYPFNKIKVETETQLQQQQHNIVDFDVTNPYLVSARKVVNKWMVNNLRDNDDKRFRGNYFIVTLTDDTDDSLKRIKISDIILNYRKPVR